jgi:glutathione S-transferase
MDKQEAKLLLSFHSGRNPDVDNPKWINGFLGVLRPFKHILPKENFHEIMECLRILSEDFESKRIEQETIADLWAICHLSGAWALNKDGMLQGNGLLTQEQIQILDDWINMISYAVMNLLDGDTTEAFCEYKEYLQRCRKEKSKGK